MSISYGFYNSIGGDRRYNSVQISKIFDGIVTDGIFESIGDKMMVVPGTGLTVVVGEGRAWFDHTWTENDAPLVLSIDNPHATYPRIDAVILEVDASDEVRTNTIKVIKGTPGSSPNEPTLVNAGTLHQYPLAYISVTVGISEFTINEITNKVGSNACPFVGSPLATANLSGNVLLQTIISSGTADEFNFTNIPAGYNTLRLIGILKQTFTAGQYHALPLNVKVNNDSGENYKFLDIHYEEGPDQGNYLWSTARTNLKVGDCIGSWTADAGMVAHFDLKFPSYSSNSIFKWIISNFTSGNFADTPRGTASEFSNIWISTNPITRIQVFGTFVSTISYLQLFGCAF
jgi:hypothetical protein